MITNVAAHADFKYELALPSGFGSQCPDGTVIDVNSTEPDTPYDEVYASAYLCGQDDTLDPDVPEEYHTDMYWSMFYVTNPRQLVGKFSVSFYCRVSMTVIYLLCFNDLILDSFRSFSPCVLFFRVASFIYASSFWCAYVPHVRVVHHTASSESINRSSSAFRY
jgi:hypothetical protein